MKIRFLKLLQKIPFCTFFIVLICSCKDEVSRKAYNVTLLKDTVKLYIPLELLENIDSSLFVSDGLIQSVKYHSKNFDNYCKISINDYTNLLSVKKTFNEWAAVEKAKLISLSNVTKPNLISEVRNINGYKISCTSTSIHIDSKLFLCLFSWYVEVNNKYISIFVSLKKERYKVAKNIADSIYNSITITPNYP